MCTAQAFVLGVAPQASSDIGVLLGAEGLESSSSLRGGADPDEGPRGEGQGTLLQVLAPLADAVRICLRNT